MNISSPTHQLSENGVQLPPTAIAGAGGTLRVQRCWPLPEGNHDAAELAVELTDAAGIRAGWWSQDGLQLLEAGEDPALNELGPLLNDTSDSRCAELVSHRPGKRAVVRRETSSTDQSSAVEFIKVVPSGRAGRILTGIDRAEPFHGPFRTPTVLDSTDSTVTFAGLEGISLHDPAEFTQEHWTQAWSEVCQAWELATDIPDPGSASALVHRAESEIRVLRHWFALTRRYLPDAERTELLVEAQIRQLDQMSSDRLVPSHRDLHDKQLLWSAQLGPALLDVDTACLAHPALDLGNLRAHATLRQLQELWSPQEAETVQFCVDEVAEHTGVPRSSVVVYERAALLRLGLVYAVRPQYAAAAAEIRQLL